MCIERDYTFISIRRRKKETKQLKLPYKVIYLHNNNVISFFLLYSIMECLGMSTIERGCCTTKRLNNFCVLFHFRELLLLFPIDYLNPVCSIELECSFPQGIRWNGSIPHRWTGHVGKERVNTMDHNNNNNNKNALQWLLC